MKTKATRFRQGGLCTHLNNREEVLQLLQVVPSLHSRQGIMLLHNLILLHSPFLQ